MLLIQSLSALDCQEFSSPRRDSGFITQPRSRRLGSSGTSPAPRFFQDGSCHPIPVPIPVPRAPTAVQGMDGSTGLLPYLSPSSAVTSGLASRRVSPSGRLVTDVTRSPLRAAPGGDTDPCPRRTRVAWAAPATAGRGSGPLGVVPEAHGAETEQKTPRGVTESTVLAQPQELRAP